jgi:hypothetical protein
MMHLIKRASSRITEKVWLTLNSELVICEKDTKCNDYLNELKERAEISIDHTENVPGIQRDKIRE